MKLVFKGEAPNWITQEQFEEIISNISTILLESFEEVCGKLFLHDSGPHGRSKCAGESWMYRQNSLSNDISCSISFCPNCYKESAKEANSTLKKILKIS